MGYTRNCTKGGKVVDFWMFKRKRFTEEGYSQVDWDANRLVMNTAPVNEMHWVMKFNSGMCGTGKMMNIRK